MQSAVTTSPARRHLHRQHLCHCHTPSQQLPVQHTAPQLPLQHSAPQPPVQHAAPPPLAPTAQLLGMDAGELSVTADLIRHSLDGVNEPEPPGTLAHEPWVQELLAADATSRVVFSAHGQGSTSHHLSTGLGGDHLVRGDARQQLHVHAFERCDVLLMLLRALQFLSLMQGGLIADMLVVYQGNNPSSSQVRSAIRFGLPVCGHPTIVHGGGCPRQRLVHAAAAPNGCEQQLPATAWSVLDTACLLLQASRARCWTRRLAR